MDRETKKYLGKVRGVSQEGVPNRKGGSWPNHPSMRYELPVPFSPGADNVTDVYRENYCQTFGHRAGCGHDIPVEGPEEKCETPDCQGHDEDEYGVQYCRIPFQKQYEDMKIEPYKGLPHRCSACGKDGEHRIAPGILSCES